MRVLAKKYHSIRKDIEPIIEQLLDKVIDSPSHLYPWVKKFVVSVFDKLVLGEDVEETQLALTLDQW